MQEKAIPWWRKALNFALGGIRSGFGFFPRPARLAPVAIPVFSGGYKEIPEEERALTKAFPKVEMIAPAIPAEDGAKPGAVTETKPLPEPAIAASSQLAAEHEEDAEKNEARFEFTGEHPAGAKAHVDSSASAARLKSCPDTPSVISASCEAKPEPEAASISSDEAIAETEPEQISVLAAEPEAVKTPNSEPVEETGPIDEAVEDPAKEPDPIIEDETAQEAVLEPFAEADPVGEALPEPVEEAEPEEEVETLVELETNDTPEVVDATLAEPFRELESVAEPELEEITEAETVKEFVPEPVEAAEPTMEAMPESVTEPEPAPEPIVEQIPAADAGAQLVLTAESDAKEKADAKADEKAAAKLAARQKKLDESSEQSPFSVFVGQVYDGPLDLLLDLIRKQDIDIYDIPIARITAQFLAYVNQLRAGDVDVAGEFIYTASLLIHIKSKMLLPRAPSGPEDVAEDPRRELVERLLEHERFKNAAQMLQQKQMLEAATWSNPGVREFKGDEGAEPEMAADTVDLVRVFRDILERARNRPVLDVEEDSVTVGQMIQFLARRLTMEDKPVALRRLLSHTRSERALIAMFLALLEMVRLQAILLRQDRQFSEIFIKKHTGFDTVMNEGLGNARDDWR